MHTWQIIIRVLSGCATFFHLISQTTRFPGGGGDYWTQYVLRVSPIALPTSNSQHPLRLGGPRAGLDDTENLTPSWFDPRTVQPAVSRHNDYAIPAAKHLRVNSAPSYVIVPLFLSYLLPLPHCITQSLYAPCTSYMNGHTMVTASKCYWPSLSYSTNRQSIIMQDHSACSHMPVVSL